VRPAEEGRLPVPGGEVWYRVVGSGDAVPMLVVHGGLGLVAHDYLEPLEALADFGRRVVFWDQLGCGRSDTPDDPLLYRIDRYADEIAAVKRGLDLERVHLLGQSFGGWLSLEYMARKPEGVVSLHLASTSGGVPCLVAGLKRLLAELPPEDAAAIERCELAGRYDDPRYLEASEAFTRRWVCRLDPLPEVLTRHWTTVDHAPAYRTMYGSGQFTVTGNLRNWDRTDDLGRIRVPSLVTCGRHDKFVPECAERLNAGIASCELHVFEQSAHMSHLEEPESLLAVTREFLDRAEAGPVEASATS
jgi:proline-specific peptidase